MNVDSFDCRRPDEATLKTEIRDARRRQNKRSSITLFSLARIFIFRLFSLFLISASSLSSRAFYGVARIFLATYPLPFLLSIYWISTQFDASWFLFDSRTLTRRLYRASRRYLLYAWHPHDDIVDNGNDDCAFLFMLPFFTVFFPPPTLVYFLTFGRIFPSSFSIVRRLST